MMKKSTHFKILMLLTFGLLMVVNSLFAQTRLEVTAPGSISGIYDMRAAGFGGDLPGCADMTPISGELVIVDDGTGTTSDGCESIQNDLTGKIALIDRGACEFGVKCLNAEAAGAMLVVVCNNQPTDIFAMGAGAVGDQVTIPALMISLDDCTTIRAEIPGATINVYWDPIIPSATDVVLWDGGQFDGGFGDWTTNAISPDTAVWTWTADGTSDNGNIVHSPTVCNGAAIFDANVYNAAASGTGPPYPQFSGELISPVIDCSTFEFVSLKFYTHNLRLNGNTTFAVSTDGGTTWGNETTIETENVFTSVETNLVGTEIHRYFMPELSYQANCRIRFTFDGDFYFFILDDVQLIEPERNNLRITDFFAIAPNAVTPVSQVEPFGFVADVQNIGAVEQTGVNLNLTIEDEASAVVFEEDLPYPPLPPDSTHFDVPFQGYFTPASTVKSYDGTYELTSDSIDFDPADNIARFAFETSDTTFAKETGSTRTVLPAANNWDDQEPHSWAYGNHFYVVNGDDWWATSASFGLGNADAAGIAGRLITIYLYKWDDTDENNDMEFEERERVGFAIYEIQGDESTDTIITVPFLNFPAGTPGPIDIESNQHYVVMVEYTTNDQVDFALAASEAMDYRAMVWRGNEDGIATRRYAAMLGVNGDLDAEPYSSLGFGYDIVPVVRLNIGMPTSTEDVLDEANLIKVSPNPANDKINLNVSLVETQQKVNVRILDVNGRLLMDQPYENIKEEMIEINVSDFANGAYFLHFVTESGVRTERFIVQH